MHELSILMAMAEEIKTLPELVNGGRLKQISLQIGKRSGVDLDALNFAYPLLKEQDELFHEAELLIESVPLEIQCDDCSESSQPPVYDVVCLACGSTNVRQVKGDEIMISKLEIEANE